MSAMIRMRNVVWQVFQLAGVTPICVSYALMIVFWWACEVLAWPFRPAKYRPLGLIIYVQTRIELGGNSWRRIRAEGREKRTSRESLARALHGELLGMAEDRVRMQRWRHEHEDKP